MAVEQKQTNGLGWSTSAGLHECRKLVNFGGADPYRRNHGSYQTNQNWQSLSHMRE